MSMEAIKAALNTTTGAQTIRQDLSSVITLQDEYLRPFTSVRPMSGLMGSEAANEQHE